MIVVSDTTPLISLMKASRLDVLQSLFQVILIPKAVYEELTNNQNYPEEIEQIKNCAFLQIVSVNERNAVDELRRSTGLDLGESEAIIYAEDNKADILLMDEAKGRKVASDRGLRIMGTVGVLLAAFSDGILAAEDVSIALNKLKQEGSRISDDLLQYAITKITE